MSTHLLEATELHVHFAQRAGVLARAREPVRAVDGVSFAVERGEVLALVGESGSGKSTLARALVRLVPLSSGSLSVWPANGRPIDVTRARGDELRTLRRAVQIVFQDPFASLNPRLSIGAAIAEPLEAHALARGADARARADELLDSVGLSRAVGQRLPHQLSGGQCQRAAIARALAVGPQLLICDEILSALDVSVQAQVLELLASLRRERGVAFVLVSHDLAAARWLADRVAVMHGGRIVELGPTDEVLTRPVHAHTRALVAAARSGYDAIGSEMR